MSGVIIMSPDDVFHISAEEFVAAARTKWGAESKILVNPDPRPYDVTVQIERMDESAFQVFHDRDEVSVMTDGTLEQSAEVGLWIRSLLPENLGGRLWMTDDSFTKHIELMPGMTVDEMEEYHEGEA
jgi:hypothetical protein